MRTNILISKTGVLQNPASNLINTSPVNGGANSTLLNNQITLEFYNAIIDQGGVKFPDPATVVTVGLTGTVTFKAYPSPHSPYLVDISGGAVNIATANIVPPFLGIVDSLNIVCTAVTGANYINVLIDRN